jgi:hypothetical protein
VVLKTINMLTGTKSEFRFKTQHDMDWTSAVSDATLEASARRGPRPAHVLVHAVIVKRISLNVRKGVSA